MFKACIASVGLIFHCPSWSFTCNLTAMKSNCWSNSIYTVTIDVMDSGAATPKKLATLTIPNTDNVAKQSFTCQPSQILTYRVRFDPPVWTKDKGKAYLSKSSKSLPAIINPGEVAWDISVCFANDFAGVPGSLLATGTCQCISSSIPPLDKKWLLDAAKLKDGVSH